MLAAALLILALAATGCGRKATGARPPVQKIRFATDWYPEPEQGGYYNALVRGYYAAAGLDVEILSGHPHDTADRRVAIGDAQLGMSASDSTLINHERGLPLIAFSATLEHDPVCVMVHADSPVKTFADLSHHRISVAPGVPWFRYLVTRFNLHDVQEVPLTFTVANFVHDPTYIQQAFATSEPYFAGQQGAAARVLRIGDSGYDDYRVLIGTRDYVA